MKVRSGAMRYRTQRKRVRRSCLRSDLKDESEGGSGPGGVHLQSPGSAAGGKKGLQRGEAGGRG